MEQRLKLFNLNIYPRITKSAISTHIHTSDENVISSSKSDHEGSDILKSSNEKQGSENWGGKPSDSN